MYRKQWYSDYRVVLNIVREEYKYVGVARVGILWLRAVELCKGQLCYVVQKDLRPQISNAQLPLNCWFKSNFYKSI